MLYKKITLFNKKKKKKELDPTLSMLTLAIYLVNADGNELVAKSGTKKLCIVIFMAALSDRWVPSQVASCSNPPQLHLSPFFWIRRKPASQGTAKMAS